MNFRLNFYQKIFFMALSLMLGACHQSQLEKRAEGEQDINASAYEELSIDTAQINQNIKQSNIKDEDHVIEYLVPEEEVLEGNYEYSVNKSFLDKNHLSVIVTETNLLDDSILNQKTKIVLKKEADYWQIDKIYASYQCHPNRGHQDWGKENCQ